MIKKIILVSIAVLLMISLIIFLNISKVVYSYEYPEKMPTDFNFIAKIESNEYTINTYNNTFSKSLDWGKDTIISFKIGDNDKNRIYNLIKEYNIIKYPHYYAPPTKRRIMPSFDHYFKCTFDSIDVEIKWEFNTESREKDAEKLTDFLFLIFENVAKDEQIKNLPEARMFQLD